MDRAKHWDDVYATKAATNVSWYQAYPKSSLALIARAGLEPDACIIDVGGGASVLVDCLLGQGFTAITVMDVSERAIALAKERLGTEAARAHFVVADVTYAALPEQKYDLWHDRAAFHFLTDAADRRAYINAVRRSLKSGGHLIMATFALDGPPK